jgi:hypothetical protein
MRISTLIANIRNPPPESVVGHMTRADGRTMRLLPFAVLINLVWLFLWALLARESFTGVILPTLLSVPLFVYLHLCVYFYGGANHIRLRYVACIFALGYAIAPFNFSALAYLIFGFFMIAYLVSVRTATVVIVASIGAFVLEMWWLGAPVQAIMSALIPSLTLAIIAIFTA